MFILPSFEIFGKTFDVRSADLITATTSWLAAWTFGMFVIIAIGLFATLQLTLSEVFRDRYLKKKGYLR
jgi:hypothetical protein